ncbi:hemolysin family protein [Patescibacteria group bacterium]|nr:hemolysin family protein [Patescibacteria group bacterium]
MEEDPHLVIYLALLGLLALSAFFSAAEVAFVSLSSAKVRILEDKKSRASKLVVALKSRPQRFLATILIGNNLVNIFAAGLATVVATETFGSAGLGIATGAMTLLILIFGEIIPKAFAQKHAETFALAASYPLFILGKILFPFTWLTEKGLHALGAEHSEEVSEKEVVAMVDLGAESGEIKKHEQEMIQNVLEFTDTKVEAVMTPRVEIEALEKSTTIAEAEKFFRELTHSRIPVFDGSIDKIIGILTLRQIFEHEGKKDLPISKSKLLEPIFTPASRTIRSLFQELKSRRIHIAIVVDEHGGTLGLATLEDLLEEIVGEIEDEEDVSEEGIQKLNPHTLLAAGDAQLSEIDALLGTTLAHGKFTAKNLAFLFLEKLKKLPQKNAKIRVNGAELTVEKIRGNKIEKIKIEKI